MSSEPCYICFDDIDLSMDIIVKLKCNHFFHYTCAKKNEITTGIKNCPLCRKFYSDIDKQIFKEDTKKIIKEIDAPLTKNKRQKN